MRIFVTGANGWIGSATVDELLAHGHEVVGLVRSDDSAHVVAAKGATALRGDLDDLDSLRRGARESDAVIHLANKHDFADPAGNDRAERAAVESMLAAVEGSGNAFLVANGLSGLVTGRPVVETDASPAVGPNADRGGSENLVLDSAERGVRSMAIRFAPSVHGAGDWGFVTFLSSIARQRGKSGYIGDGAAAWSAVHVSDAARLIRLGIESAPARTRLHAIAEQTISNRSIAEALGNALDLPVESIDTAAAGDHFGFMTEFFGVNLCGSSDATAELTGWRPTGPTLLEDIAAGAYCGDTREDR